MKQAIALCGKSGSGAPNGSGPRRCVACPWYGSMNTTYIVSGRYSEKATETAITKIRRIFSKELEKGFENK